MAQFPPKLFFRQLFDHLGSSTYTYLLADEDSKEAILIDPVKDQAERDEKLLGEFGFTLKYAINTHAHADHISATAILKSKLPGVKSVISTSSGGDADVHVKHGDVIRFGSFQLECLSTPGHTSGCTCFYFGAGNCVFSGDVLFIRGCGRTDFQGGSSEDLYDSVHTHLFTLGDTTVVYPGHDYKGMLMTTIGEEKRLNPRLGMGKTKEEFVAIMKGLNLPYPKLLDVAVPVNLKDGREE